jgi:hypothetical protein
MYELISREDKAGEFLNGALSSRFESGSERMSCTDSIEHNATAMSTLIE